MVTILWFTNLFWRFEVHVANDSVLSTLVLLLIR